VKLALQQQASATGNQRHPSPGFAPSIKTVTDEDNSCER
jgi:hypothetical protein